MANGINRREFLKASTAAGVAVASKGITSAFAQELKPIQLLPPQLDRGRPLMQVLKDRKSTRTYSKKEIPLQVLSNLLWAAFGINRPSNGLRTAPSKLSFGEVDIYVATAEGIFFYDAKINLLKPVVPEDLRRYSGRQFPPPGISARFATPLDEAPINLIYVWDSLKKSRYYSAEINLCLAFSHTGMVSQNVYLYCASEGLATVVRKWFDKSGLEQKMKLRPEQYATLVQSVAYPTER